MVQGACTRGVIIPANFRDLSYIASNLRPEDQQELECQLDEWSPQLVAYQAMHSTFGYICELNGNPEVAFGAGQIRQGYWIAWSWGTRRQWRCLPTVIQYISHDLQPLVSSLGARRVEARALSSHSLAHRFLERIGGKRRCDLPGYGKNGEDFCLYDWTQESWSRHVPIQSTRNATTGGSATRAAGGL